MLPFGLPKIDAQNLGDDIDDIGENKLGTLLDRRAPAESAAPVIRANEFTVSKDHIQ